MLNIRAYLLTSNEHSSSGWLLDIFILSSVWILAIALTNPFGDFPINDDWVYAAAVRSLVLDGRFEIYSFSSANVGPQVFWGALFAQIFGLSFNSLRLSTLILGLVGGIAIYFAFREIWKVRAGALILSLSVLLNPLYFSLSHSFMTDVPFFALIAIAICLIVTGLNRDKAALMGAGAFVGIVTMLVRQFAVVVLAGFAVAFIVLRGVSIKTVIVAALPLLIGLLTNWLFTKWLVDTGRKPFAGGVSTLTPELSMRFFWTTKATLFAALSYCGLLLIPLATFYLPYGSRRAGVIRNWQTIAVLIVSVVLAYAYGSRGLSVPIGDNVWSWFGVGPLTNGDTLMRSQNLPAESVVVKRAWIVVTALAIVASSCLLTSVGAAAMRVVGVRARFRDQRSRVRLAIGAFLVTYASSYLFILVILASGYTIFDRYMLPLMIAGGLGLPLLRSPGSGSINSGWRRGASVVSLLAIAIFSIVATHDFLRWSDVRWSATQSLLNEGISAERIDGGYEFNGWYLYDPKYEPLKTKDWWWVHDDEFQLSSGPIDGYDEYRRYPVKRWWNNGLSDVIVSRRSPVTDRK